MSFCLFIVAPSNSSTTIDENTEAALVVAAHKETWAIETTNPAAAA